MAKAIDLTGNKFGKLLVLRRAEDYVTFDGDRCTQWLCKCDCGNECVVRTSSLRRGSTSSCGCGHKGGRRGRKRGRKPMSEARSNRANICIDCKKACGGCSWSARDPATGKLLWQPVPGWTAEEVPYVLYRSGNGYCKEEMTYKITACPEFEEDKSPNTHDCRQLTKEESDWFLDNIRRVLRKWATEEEVQCVRG